MENFNPVEKNKKKKMIQYFTNYRLQFEQQDLLTTDPIIIYNYNDE